MSSPFAGKAAAYAKYRTDYPPEAIELVVARAGLSGEQVVVDLGSGTGILARQLLPHARLVYAVEPAEDMRLAAEAALGNDARFRSVAGTAERTGLPDALADAITCGNSFHYFDPERARGEVERVLRPEGHVVVIFHDTPVDPPAFTRDYLMFLESATPPELTSAHSPTDHERRLAAFFGGRTTTRDTGEQDNRLSWDQLRGRFSSTSIAPPPEASTYEPTFLQLRELFDRHQENGFVTLTLAWICVSALWA
jgi:SAM-dependent methyltransferase